MPHLRLVLAWLIMLALPLQGFASASMVFCAAEHHGTGAAHQQAYGHAPHDHAAHVHPPASVEQASADGPTLPDLNHQCGVCASCCHSVAVAQADASRMFVPLERPHLAESFLRIDTAPAAVPDKPPRT